MSKTPVPLPVAGGPRPGAGRGGGGVVRPVRCVLAGTLFAGGLLQQGSGGRFQAVDGVAHAARSMTSPVPG
jgi:hypothetical protein